MVQCLSVSLEPVESPDVSRIPSAASALTGFLLSGFLFALPGTLLPAWGYHIQTDFATIGNYFLSLSAGVIGAGTFSRILLPRRGLAFQLVSACVLACCALLYLALLSPLAAPAWRMCGMAGIGVAMGLLNIALFHAISPRYSYEPAGAVSLGGIYYGLGSLIAPLLVAGTYHAYTVPSILILVAVVPGYFAVIYARGKFPPVMAGRQPTMREAFRDVRSPGAVLFALLLFFQFGNEWSVAGWLPLFLIRRLGISPESSLFLLALYCISLLVGRLAVVSVLPRVRHGKLLMGCAGAALFGCILLLFTNNTFGAGTGAMLTGAGFAGIYPLVAEKIGRRFPYYNPALFSGIFSFAIMGGLLAPASLGYFAAILGIGVAMSLPLFGTCMVVVLLLLVWLEAKLTGQ